MDASVNKAPVPETDWASKDIELVREGTQIKLPAMPTPMSTAEGIKTLQRIKKAEDMVYTISENIEVHFFDGLVALAKALKHKFGYSGTTQTTIKTMFGPMKVAPRLIHVKVGHRPDDFVQVPFGTFQFPGTECEVETRYGMSHGIPVLQITGEVKSDERKIIMEIIELVQKFAKETSIYKGRSIILERNEEAEGLDFDQQLAFFDPFSGREIPIFNKEIENLIDVTLLTPIRHSKTFREKGVPLKRGILLEGPYGCGKSLTARQAAQVANDAGWTFINVTASSALKYALRFAKLYQPCVVFAEDIDRSVGNRGEKANDLINEIDGVVGKNDEIITVLTTNHVDKIEKAMLRPGRLDAVISVKQPDAETVGRLIEFYAEEYLEDKADLKGVSNTLDGTAPAVVREVVERAKSSMIGRGAEKINAGDLEASALSMKNHLEIFDRANEGKPPEDALAITIGKIVNAEVGKALVKKFG